MQGASFSCIHRQCSGTAYRSGCFVSWCSYGFGFGFFSISPVSLSLPSCPAGSNGNRYTPSPSSRLVDLCSFGFHFSMKPHWNDHLISVLILPVTPKHVLCAWLTQKDLCGPCHRVLPSSIHVLRNNHSPLFPKQSPGVSPGKAASPWAQAAMRSCPYPPSMSV